VSAADLMLRAELAATVLAAWLLTYAIHSTALLGAVALWAGRARWSHAAREVAWKAALVGGVASATLQAGLGLKPLGGRLWLASTSGALSLRSGPPVPLVAGERQTVAGLDRQVGGGGRSQTAPSGAPAAVRWPKPIWLVALWIALGGLSAASYAGRRLWLAQRMGPRRAVRDPSLGALLDELKARAGLRRSVRLTTAPGISSPVALGIREICLPDAALRQLDREQQRSMLAHEVAHLARFDPAWLTTACLLERVLFFQPLNRVARRRLQESAEFLCDDWAVRHTGSGFSLAQCLVRVAEWIDSTPHPVPVAGMAEERSQLVSRVRRLVEDRRMSAPSPRRWLLLGAGALLAGAVLLVPGFTLARQERPARDPLVGGAQVDQDSLLRLRRGRPLDQLAGARAGLTAELAGARAGLKRLLRTTPALPRMSLPWDDRIQDSSGAVVAALAGALRDPDVGVRRAAAHALGNRSDRRAVPALIEGLKDADVEVRATAARALGDLQDRRGVAGLTGALQDQSAEVRHAAFLALIQFEDVPLTEPLLAALKDPDAEIRARAAQALGERRERSAIQPLAVLLSDGSAEVRHAAVQSLAEIRDPAAGTAVAGALKDRDADVRAAAAQALAELHVSPVPEALLGTLRDQHPDVRRAAAQALGELQDARAVPGLRVLLQDPSADVREAAVEALSAIRDGAAIEALVLALKSSDPSVRRAAAEALGQH